MGILNFSRHVGWCTITLNTGKGRKGVAENCGVAVVDFVYGVLNSFEDC